MSHRRLLIPFALVLALAGDPPAARAEVWGYVDADGTAHVATEKLDERYQLFFKGKNAADPRSASMADDRPSLRALRETPIYKRLVDHPNIRRYEALIEQSARARGLDTALVKAVIAVESAFEPAAVSAKGALGLMQVMPDTGARYGVVDDRKRTQREKLLDPAINLRIGTTYLSELQAMFPGDITLALAAYNAGEQTVLNNRNRIPPYPETREYVKLVQQFYELYRPPDPTPPSKKPPRIIVPLPSGRP
ncbi:MAG: lytic transglycosylase domain-containing protein [Betaproteobacteria bacterium]